jgi:hypothetical protein
MAQAFWKLGWGEPISIQIEFACAAKASGTNMKTGSSGGAYLLSISAKACSEIEI